jgi:hypothetical protein
VVYTSNFQTAFVIYSSIERISVLNDRLAQFLFLNMLKSIFMPLNIKKPGKSHDKRIHLEEPREAVYWSKKFEVSSTQLLEAIKVTGSNRVETVAKYISDKISNHYH